MEVFLWKERKQQLKLLLRANHLVLKTMAQEESRHISENVKWTFKRLMEKGNAFGPGPYGFMAS